MINGRTCKVKRVPTFRFKTSRFNLKQKVYILISKGYGYFANKWKKMNENLTNKYFLVTNPWNVFY